ncbi:metallophosphoesterase [Novosphingobium sp.]|uniref:metallophosphoesterase n=1 Tax=Novosphingobium sp. TaxID=1874826 RepID=UPI0026017B2B|nr:metallophosphoesterase [Novosphingobium sp.]
MSAIFVHLSDIHFGQEKDGSPMVVNADARDRLIDDARTEVAKLGGKATGVIVTGDIAYSAQRKQYQEAGAWLARLTDAIGCDQIDVQMVPGNHDIDRNKISITMESVLFAAREGGDKMLDPHLDNVAECKTLYERFEAYADFALDYQCDLDLKGSISTSGTLDLAEGRSIRFVRINSALICSKNDSEGKLILGGRQRVLPIEDGVEIVVLVHHPLNWFSDSEAARGYLKGRARVFISGHEHFPKLKVEAVEDGCDLMMLAAGATNPDDIDETFTYKYNILVFDWDEEKDALSVTINPRTWNAGMQRFERDDAFLEGIEERQVLASPNFRKAPKPVLAKAPGQEVAEADEPEVVEEPVPIEVQVLGATEEAAETMAEAEAEPPPSTDARLLQLRFFQELAGSERTAALIDLGAVNQGQADNLDHAMERRLFRRLVRQGKTQEIEQRLDAGKTEKDGQAA